ncbi:hypothetical protein HPB47_015987 [Ixodes persulcatus]|uniref:Uncharacterized protein n=1 Tax=Ixodes persulcatus TaxID=34615 RepID=A0AC60QSY1_IXOPE|nr:hypothetical protein HPB47_015987 [Ixodes persulcatus]
MMSPLGSPESSVFEDSGVPDSDVSDYYQELFEAGHFDFDSLAISSSDGGESAADDDDEMGDDAPENTSLQRLQCAVPMAFSFGHAERALRPSYSLGGAACALRVEKSQLPLESPSKWIVCAKRQDFGSLPVPPSCTKVSLNPKKKKEENTDLRALATWWRRGGGEVQQEASCQSLGVALEWMRQYRLELPPRALPRGHGILWELQKTAVQGVLLWHGEELPVDVAGLQSDGGQGHGGVPGCLAVPGFQQEHTRSVAAVPVGLIQQPSGEHAARSSGAHFEDGKMSQFVVNSCFQ